MIRKPAPRFAAALITTAMLLSMSPATLVDAAQTAPNTNIVNNATATYKDANNVTYSTTSNTVVTIVQNAPVLTNVATAGVQYSPSGQAIDTYTITNTGNASGKFQLDTAGSTGGTGVTFGGTDVPAITTPGGGPTSTVGCGSGASQFAVTIGGTTTNCDNVTSLNAFLNTQTIATGAGNAITIQVFYTIPAGAGTAGSPTYTTTIKPNITYAVSGSAVAETSADVSATVTNTVAADARLDLYKESSQNGVTGDLTYTVYAHNGGANDAKDLAAVKALLGSVDKGILITDKVPVFGGSALALSNSGAVTVTTQTANGYPSNAATLADVYYTTDATGAASWVKAAGNLPTDGTVKFIGVFIHKGTTCTSGAGWDLCSDTGHATNPGNVNVKTNYAVKFVFTTVQPSGNGSANAGAVTNLANGVIGDNQSTERIVGPGCSANDAATASLITSGGCGVVNTTLTSVGGASNQIGNQALSINTPLNGPSGQAAATGSFDGDLVRNANDSNHDFTAYSFFGAATDNVVNTSTTPGSPTTATKVNGAVSLCIPHTEQNNGNKDDTYTTLATAPTTGYTLPNTNFAGGTASAGWTVAIYSDATCSTTLISGAAAATVTANIAVTSGSSSNYYVLYANANAGNTLPYLTRFHGSVLATSVNDNTKSNTTYDELYSSFIALTKSANVTSTGCPAGASPSLPATDATGAKVCPGGQIAYAVDYRNLALGVTSTAVSFTNVIATAGTLVLTDDGTKSVSGAQSTIPNWAAFATMTGAPVDKDSTASTRGATASKYCTSIPSGLPGTPCAGASFATSDTAFQSTVGGASFTLIPHTYPGWTVPTATQDWQGTLSFTIQVQ